MSASTAPADTAQNEGEPSKADAQLLHAVRWGVIADVRKALADGASVHACDEAGRPALVIAAYANHPVIFQVLLDEGADLDCADANGNTAVMHCCLKGHLPLLQLCITMGAKLNKPNKFDKEPAFMAMQHGHTACSDALVKAGALEEDE